jgi:hypothetical protein
MRPRQWLCRQHLVARAYRIVAVTHLPSRERTLRLLVSSVAPITVIEEAAEDWS